MLGFVGGEICLVVLLYEQATLERTTACPWGSFLLILEAWHGACARTHGGWRVWGRYLATFCLLRTSQCLCKQYSVVCCSVGVLYCALILLERKAFVRRQVQYLTDEHLAPRQNAQPKEIKDIKNTL